MIKAISREDFNKAVAAIPFTCVMELADGNSLRQWPNTGAWSLHDKDGALDYFLSTREQYLAFAMLEMADRFNEREKEAEREQLASSIPG